MKKNKKKIFFIRHAETFANTGEKFDHPQHIKLTDKGHKQAKKIVAKINNPSRIYISKYFRTLETAQYTIEKFPKSKVLLSRFTHEFTYTNPKKTLHLEKEKQIKYIQKYWKNLNPQYSDGDIAESFEHFIKRIQSVSKYLKDIDESGNIYLFTHGNFSRGFLLMHNEYKKYLNKSIDSKKLKQIMQRFRETYNSGQYKLENCEILEVTNFYTNEK